MAAIPLSELTEVKLDGNGVFDALMRASKTHLEDQWTKGAIRGPEYATVYLGQLESSMQTALAFLTQRARIGLEATLLEKQIALAEVELQKAGVQLTILQEEAQTAVVQRGLIEAQVLKVEADVRLSEAQLENVTAEKGLIEANITRVTAETLIVPKQGAQIEAQTALVIQQKLNAVEEVKQTIAQTSLVTSNKTKIDAETLLVPKQGELLDAQLVVAEQQGINAEVEKRVLEGQVCKLAAEFDYTKQNVLKAAGEVTLLAQKTATEKAQIIGLGVDADSVVGRQKALYVAQTTGFARDAEQKAAGLYVDVWKTLRMTDNEWQANATQGLDDATMGGVLSKLRQGINT